MSFKLAVTAHCVVIRVVNSREISFPAGKQISRDSDGTRASIAVIYMYV